MVKEEEGTPLQPRTGVLGVEVTVQEVEVMVRLLEAAEAVHTQHQSRLVGMELQMVVVMVEVRCCALLCK